MKITKNDTDMKNALRILAIALVTVAPLILTAQPQPWDPAVGGGINGYPAGGAAPIGGGLVILLSMAIGYATRKFYALRKKVN